MKRFALTFGVLCALILPAFAQTPVYLGLQTANGQPAGGLTFNPISSGNPLPVTGSFSASLSGFRPVAYGTPISVTTGGVTGTLPTNTGQVVATNVGTTNGAYCALGASATTSSQYIAPNGGWFGFAISGDTQLTCITATSTTTVNLAGGSGLPTGTGGGGGGGGSSGAVFGPTAVGSAAANPPVLSGGTADGTATGNVGVWKIVSGVGSENLAQVNGVTVLTGSGAVGTGAQRIAVGTDTATIAGSAPGTAGSPSTNVVSVQGVESGTALPISVASLPLPSGAATSALQGTNTATTAHTCSVVGYSELGCLGQIDDDVKGSIAAGSNDIGGIYTTSFAVSVTPTVTASSTYAAGNEVGGLMTFASVTRTPKFSGKIDTITITSKSIQSAEFDLYLCDVNPSSSTWTDKTGPAINSADVSKCKWMIPLTANASGLGTYTSYTATGLGLSFLLPSSGTSLYGILVTPQIPSAQFGSTTDLVVTVAGPMD